MPTWRDALRDSLATTSSFADHCKALGAGKSGWTHADTDELVGLEQWGTALALHHRAAGIGALVTAARAGFAGVVAAGGSAFDNLGLTGTEGEPIVDGASCEVQIGRAERWLADPAALAQVAEALDPSRQLYMWDDDLRPDDTTAYYWYLDVGQLCSSAIVNQDKPSRDPDGDGYYEWPSENCVGRGLVAIARAHRTDGVAIADVLAQLNDALVAAAGKTT